MTDKVKTVYQVSGECLPMPRIEIPNLSRKKAAEEVAWFRKHNFVNVQIEESVYHTDPFENLIHDSEIFIDPYSQVRWEFHFICEENKKLKMMIKKLKEKIKCRIVDQAGKCCIR